MGKLLLPNLRAYRVRDDFLAGSYPGNADPAIATGKLATLVGIGVTDLVNLMEEDEMHWSGAPIVDYGLFLEGLSPDTALNMHRFPIPDMQVPSELFMQDILDHIDALREAGRTVYLHCLGGVGRTGTVVGCWLVRHGLAIGEDALVEISRLREFDPMLDMPSPQTDEQCAMVRTWEPGR